jgi:hypothetical protein
MRATVQPAVADAPIDWDAGVLKALYGLVFSMPDREVAGVLVGVPPAGTETGLPFIRAAIPATQGYMPGQASLFLHQTWAQVHATMARHYAGLEAVGWYVSRAGQGTGLTEADVLNHRRWFARPDQVLLVVDSLTHHAAVYAWSGGQLVQLTEGAVARRYTRPPRSGFPLAGVGLLVVLGVALGIVAFVIAQALGG